MSDFKTSELRDTSRELQELREQLAASQAREQQLREALEVATSICWSNFSEAQEIILEKALAIPSDTTALEAMIRKAGEVMRERSLHSIPFGQIAICGAIRALPSITLTDIK